MKETLKVLKELCFSQLSKEVTSVFCLNPPHSLSLCHENYEYPNNGTSTSTTNVFSICVAALRIPTIHAF